MNTHETGRLTNAWRERNEGAEAPGDGINVPRYVETTETAGEPAPGTVGVKSTDNHPGAEPASTEVEAEEPKTEQRTANDDAPAKDGPPKAAQRSKDDEPEVRAGVDSGLSTKSAPGLLGKRRT